MGFSMLSGVNATYSSFFFVSLKPWEERKTPETSYEGIKAHLQRTLSKVSSGIAFSFSPPAIPGVGTSGGATFILEDRSGGGVDFLAKNAQLFVSEARKRPELAGVMTTALFGVPQVGVKVDNAKAMTQQIQLSSLYETVQTFMGGALVNYFNRFGLQWQVYVQADGDFRNSAENVGKFYVRNAAGGMVPLSTLTTTYPRNGAEFMMRYNLFNCVQINAAAAPGYSSAQAMAALEDVFQKSMPSQMGFDYMGMSYQEQKAAQGVSAGDHLWAGLLRGFPHHGSAVRELDATVQRTAGSSHCRFRRFRGTLRSSARQRCVCPDWPGHADWIVGQECHSDRRICQGRVRERQIPDGRRTDRSQTAIATHSDDRIRFHSRLRTPVDGFRRRCISRQVLGTVVIGGMMAASVLAIFFIPVSYDVVERFGIWASGKKKHPQEMEIRPLQGAADD